MSAKKVGKQGPVSSPSQGGGVPQIEHILGMDPWKGVMQIDDGELARVQRYLNKCIENCEVMDSESDDTSHLRHTHKNRKISPAKKSRANTGQKKETKKKETAAPQKTIAKNTTKKSKKNGTTKDLIGMQTDITNNQASLTNLQAKETKSRTANKKDQATPKQMTVRAKNPKLPKNKEVNKPVDEKNRKQTVRRQTRSHPGMLLPNDANNNTPKTLRPRESATETDVRSITMMENETSGRRPRRMPQIKLQENTGKPKKETTKKVAGNAKKVTAKSKKNVRAMKTSNENEGGEQNKNGDKPSTKSSLEVSCQSKEASIITNDDAVASSHQNQPAQSDCSTEGSKMPVDAKSDNRSSEEIEKSMNNTYVADLTLHFKDIDNSKILNEQFTKEFQLLSEFENAVHQLRSEEGASMNYVKSEWDTQYMDHKNTEHQDVDFINGTSTPKKIIKQEPAQNNTSKSFAIKRTIKPTTYVCKNSSRLSSHGKKCNSKKEVTKKRSSCKNKSLEKEDYRKMHRKLMDRQHKRKERQDKRKNKETAKAMLKFGHHVVKIAKQMGYKGGEYEDTGNSKSSEESSSESSDSECCSHSSCSGCNSFDSDYTDCSSSEYSDSSYTESTSN